ncbi:hypothetical protein EDB92DRAFT_1946606 [Lactarius akahatsu]|uniref:DUF6535 domain-containing protein n=1 Tax=Lactarius akahatsu TaxID=416441 RepID=A0AAD4QCY7_9AGAM|nr:hypothetical protein EDB92DRAFT_1946606 [Lactarius akahatsu]
MPPSGLSVDPEAQTDVEDCQVDDTAEKRSEYNTKTQTSAENHGDLASRPCSMYPTEAKEEDDQMTKNWTEDTGGIKGGILVFAGLLSIIVAVFITESYKKLSPDSGDQTVALLTQLVGFSTGAPVVVQNIPPFKPPASIVRVNVMWTLSLTSSLFCALLAALREPWARRYLEHAQDHGAPRRRTRILAYMFEGVEKFCLSQAVEATSLLFLLHTSVFLFFAGLIDFLLPINEVVAFSVLGCIAVFASTYTVSTQLPGFRLDRTPLFWITHIPIRLSALNLFSISKANGIFRGLLPKIRRQSHPNMWGSPSDWPAKWRTILEHKALAHYERLLRCLRLMVMLGAMEAQPRVDASTLHSTHTTLNDDKESEDLAARMPGSFDSRASPDTTLAMLSLLAEQPEKPTSDPTLGSRLHELLETCLSGASLLTKEQRRNCLRVILKRLWCCVRTYDLSENSEVPLAPFVRAISASPDVIGRIRTEQDPAVRLLGRCFGSLIIKRLASSMTSPTHTSIVAFTLEMACLSSILGATSEQVRDWLGQEGAIDLVNVISLASGEFETLVASGTEGDVGDVFQQTLSILAEGIVSSRANVEWDPGDLPVDLVARFHEIYFKFANAPVPDVLKEQLRHILDRLPPRSYV